MKIGVDSAPKAFPETYVQHLVSVLERHAPQHDFIIDSKSYNDVDIYHGFKYSLPLSVHLRRVRSVMTVFNLNFLRYPQAYSSFDRWVLLWLYRYSCRRADCVITLSRSTKEELVERLSIDERKVKVVMPLAAHIPSEDVDKQKLDVIRKKYSLPDNYVLMIGVAEPRRHPLEVIHAMADAEVGAGLVVCGRRTAYSDFLLRYTRAVGSTPNVEFVYEPDAVDVPALFRMARAFVYLPDAKVEASLVPVIEALRAGVPMVLSDTPLHREAAGEAALYVAPGAEDELVAALRCVVCDHVFRRGLIERQRARAELFSEYAVAQRLVDIYTSL